MKTLRYFLLTMLLCCSLMSAGVALGQEFKLEVTLVGVDESGAGMLVQFTDGEEIVAESVGVADDCRFLDIARKEYISYDEFIKRFMGWKIEIVFVEKEVAKDGETEIEYQVIECSGRVTFAS